MIPLILSVFIIHSAPFDEVAQRPLEPCEKPLHLKAGQTIRVQNFTFLGNRKISESDLQKVVRPFCNRLLSEKDLAEIERRIERFYQRKGYQKIEAMIPASQKGQALAIRVRD